MNKCLKIDMHMHCCLEHGCGNPRGEQRIRADELRQIYDDIGVEKGVEMTIVSPESLCDPITNKEAEKLAKLFPNTVGWWFCGMDPRMGTNSPDANLSYFFDYFKEHGARGVGEMTANLPLDDPRYMNLFSHIEKSGLPVTIHFGELGKAYGAADELHLPKLYKLLAAFPKLIILGHAMPFWAEISADVTSENRMGYPSGPVVREGELVRILRRFPNLWCDLSAGSGYNALVRDPDYAYEFLREFSDRIVYATDIAQFAHRGAKMLETAAFLDNAYEIGVISKQQYHAITRENALRLLEPRR